MVAGADQRCIADATFIETKAVEVAAILAGDDVDEGWSPEWIEIAAMVEAGDAIVKGHHREEQRFDIVMAWSVDRLGRSLQDLVVFLCDLKAVKVDLFILKQGVDTTPPIGKMMLQMLGVFAEFERALIQDRVRAGLAWAKKDGTKSGRAIGRPKMTDKTKAAIQRGKAEGLSVRAIAARWEYRSGQFTR